MGTEEYFHIQHPKTSPYRGADGGGVRGPLISSVRWTSGNLMQVLVPHCLGALVRPDCPSTLARTHVLGDISLARTQFCQVFHRPSSWPISPIICVPLPRGVVSKLNDCVGGLAEHLHG